MTPPSSPPIGRGRRQRKLAAAADDPLNSFPQLRKREFTAPATPCQPPDSNFSRQAEKRRDSRQRIPDYIDNSPPDNQPHLAGAI